MCMANACSKCMHLSELHTQSAFTSGEFGAGVVGGGGGGEVMNRKKLLISYS